MPRAGSVRAMRNAEFRMQNAECLGADGEALQRFASYLHSASFILHSAASETRQRQALLLLVLPALSA